MSDPKWTAEEGARMAEYDFGLCPACGLSVGVAFAPGDGPMAATHLLPMCPDFDRREAQEFLCWVIDVRGALRRPAVPE